MWTRLTRIPLRRCLHTSPLRPQPAYKPSRLGFVLGASAVAATYLTFRLTSDSHRLALDGPSHPSSIKQSQPPTRYPSFSPTPASSEPTPSKSTETKSTPPLQEQFNDSISTPEIKPPIVAEGDEASEGTAEVGADDESPEGSGGAYNPVTGEINWDCPCLGGMAHGPCGPEFREAFSCFVYSEDEPKGINCVEKFKAMQNCFREHPDVYGEEIMDDEDDEELVTPGNGDEYVEGVATHRTSAEDINEANGATSTVQRPTKPKAQLKNSAESSSEPVTLQPSP